MNKNYHKILNHLKKKKYKWLITGVAGFIGSNILELLLKHNQIVIGLDNFSTGNQNNLLDVKKLVTKKQWSNFKFFKINISSPNKKFNNFFKKTDFVLHQAALGSVPRSVKNPLKSNKSNVDGFLNVLDASRKASVKRFIYASSSSTYGDHPKLPKIENKTGKLLSPYAATKFINEIYADVFSRTYKLSCLGLRYFNVFGRRQDPNGSYAAVIPKWVNSIIKNKKIDIFGDGKTSRDFCYIDNVVSANLLAALSIQKKEHEIFNIAVGERTSLNELFKILQTIASDYGIKYPSKNRKFLNFRNGDVKHSLANINKAKKKIGYKPLFFFKKGIKETFKWYIQKNDQRY